MTKSTVLWILAFAVTVTAATYQEMTGPTFPLHGSVAIGGQQYPVKLARTHGGPGGQPVAISIPDSSVQGHVVWRRYPGNEAWQKTPLARNGAVLQASLPHQPPAGKLAYHLQLTRPGEQVVFPEHPAVTRFKGDVPAFVLIPHVFAMFTAMFLSTRAGFEAAVNGPNTRRYARIGLLLLAVGGFILGPIVQKLAFGAFWTGVPWGYDLTDNKTLIAGVGWLLAVWQLGRGRSARWWVIGAALLTLAVFAIPHSAWGSEIKWQGQ